MSSDEGYQYPPDDMEGNERFEAFKQWEEDQLRAKGVKIPVSPIGETVHPDTVKSYNNLRMKIEDTPYYASRRPAERTKMNIVEVNDRPPKIVTFIRRIMRLKEKDNDNEYLVYSYEDHFRDLNHNHVKVDYSNALVHEEIYGTKKKDIHQNTIQTEKKGTKLVYEMPWSIKNFRDIMKKHSSSTDELNKLGEDNLLNKLSKENIIEENAGQPEFIIGFARMKGSKDSRSINTSDPIYSIKNISDFENGTFQQLHDLGERALSAEKPSLDRLKQPIMADGATSLWRKNLPVQHAILQEQE